MNIISQVLLYIINGLLLILIERTKILFLTLDHVVVPCARNHATEVCHSPLMNPIEIHLK